MVGSISFHEFIFNEGVVQKRVGAGAVSEECQHDFGLEQININLGVEALSFRHLPIQYHSCITIECAWSMEST